MTDAQWLLALDTSTDWAGIALTDGEVLAELNWTAGRRQTTQVMPKSNGSWHCERDRGPAGCGCRSDRAGVVSAGYGLDWRLPMDSRLPPGFRCSASRQSS